MNPGENIVIIGGGPAGLSTAQAFRESGGRGEVTILAAESYPPYRRPPLTKEFLRGEVSREELPMQSAGWFEENGVDLRTNTRVVSLDPERRLVSTDGGEDIPYGSCVLATGSEPFRLPVPGGDDPGILTMRTIEDSVELQGRVGEDEQVIVVGSGFIGCEAAASLAMRGAKVTLISMESSPQSRILGEEVGGRIEAWLKEHGVELRLGASVEEIERAGDDFVVRIEGGETAAAETVLFGTGVKPRVELAEKAGLEMENGAISCDSSMHTSAPGVFAVGDIALARNEAAGRRLRVEHWGEALNMGRVAGIVLAGGEAVWEVAPGFWSTIGGRTLKYVAWGDGYDEARFVDRGGGAFTVWYGADGVIVGALTHNHDADYEEGRDLVESGAPLPR